MQIMYPKQKILRFITRPSLLQRFMFQPPLSMHTKTHHLGVALAQLLHYNGMMKECHKFRPTVLAYTPQKKAALIAMLRFNVRTLHVSCEDVSMYQRMATSLSALKQ